MPLKLAELGKEYVKMKDPEKVQQLLDVFQKEKEKVMVMIDFDHTITKQHVNGKPSPSSFDILTASERFPEAFHRRLKEHSDSYCPKYLDSSLSDDEKVPFILEWFKRDLDLIVEYKMTLHDLTKVAKESEVQVRDNTEEMFKTLALVGAPIMIISAGIGEVITGVLKNRSLYEYSSKHILANYFALDEEDCVTGLSCDERLHMFNKNRLVADHVKNSPDLVKRTNVLVIGDNLSDNNMADDLPPPNNLIKIGFLDRNKEDRLEKFLEHFDIVLIDDQTMDTVNGIVRWIAA